MKYKVIWRDKTKESLKEINLSDWGMGEKIKEAVEKNLASNPKQNGKPLWGKWKGFFRYRCFDKYRVIYQIKNKELLIIMVKVGHRREVY